MLIILNERNYLMIMYNIRVRINVQSVLMGMGVKVVERYKMLRMVANERLGRISRLIRPCLNMLIDHLYMVNNLVLPIRLAWYI